MNRTDEPARLPEHIEALLQRQQRSSGGLAADSAGVAWKGRDLEGDGNPLHTFDGDDGLIDPNVRISRADFIAGTSSEAEFVNALATARLFVAVMADVSAEGESAEGIRADKQADISLVSLESADGRRTLPVFTQVETLTRWSPQARPVAATAAKVMLAALAEEAEWVVLDPGADFTCIIRRPAVEALAQGSPWVPSYQDEELASSLTEVTELCPGVAQLQLGAHPGIGSLTRSGEPVAGGGPGPELRVTVVCDPELDHVQRRFAVASVKAALGQQQMLRRRADSVEVALG